MAYTIEDIRAGLSARGIDVSKRRLVDWIQKGLLPRPEKRGRGRGLGISALWHQVNIVEQAANVALSLKSNRRVAQAYLPLWLMGFEVPHGKVRRPLIDAWQEKFDVISDADPLRHSGIVRIVNEICVVATVDRRLVEVIVHATLDIKPVTAGTYVNQVAEFIDGIRSSEVFKSLKDLLEFLLTIPRDLHEIKTAVETASDATLDAVQTDLRVIRLMKGILGPLPTSIVNSADAALLETSLWLAPLDIAQRVAQRQSVLQLISAHCGRILTDAKRPGFWDEVSLVVDGLKPENTS